MNFFGQTECVLNSVCDCVSVRVSLSEHYSNRSQLHAVRRFEQNEGNVDVWKVCIFLFQHSDRGGTKSLFCNC